MENTPTNNIPNEQTIAENGNINTPVDNSAFYNNYTKQPGTVAYNVPAYTPVAQQTVYRSAPLQNNQSPSAIYNSTRVGSSAPQYHYGNPTAPGIINNTYLQEQQIKKQEERNAVKTLRTIGNFTGFSVVVLMLRSLISNFLFLLIPGLSNILNSGFGGLMLANLLLSVWVIGVTYFFLHLILKCPADKITKEKKYKSTIKLGAPKKPFKAFLLILIGFAGCMIANYIVSFISVFFSSMGIDSGYMSFDNPSGIAETIVMFIAIAVIPPLIEEFSMRGVLLSSMQKYGNAFTILATAFVFGIFHGNFTQIPFAFICGLFFAYIAIATDSLWPSIIVHAINNSMSCISTVLMQHFDETVANVFYYVAFFSGILLGTIALIIYLVLYKKEFILKAPSKIPAFSTSKKFRKFMSSPGMIIATVFCLLQAVVYLLISSSL